MERWVGKTAVITGAGGGIGGAITERLVKEGLRVVGLDVNFTQVAKFGPNFESHSKVCLKRDLTNLDELTKTFALIDEKYGGVDVMINCAGYVKLGQITSVGTDPLSDAEIAYSMDVNIKAMIFCSRFAVDSMRRRGVDGHIINFNSIAGHYVAFSDSFNVYSSSKHAVTAFTQSLTYEMSHFNSRIKTTSLSPGLVQSPMSSKTVKDFSAVSSLQPSDIADAVVYVLSTPPHVNITELTVQPVGELRM